MPIPARIDDHPQSSQAEVPIGAAVDAAAVLHLHNIPGVGKEAARLMELDAFKERWRQVKHQFVQGLTIMLSSGELKTPSWALVPRQGRFFFLYPCFRALEG